MEPSVIHGRTLVSVLPEKLQTSIRKARSLEDDEEYCSIRLTAENGAILGIKPSEEPIAEKRLLLPLLFNAHTHLGDSFIARHYARDEMPRDIVSLVSPPDGLKHRLLREAKNEEVIQGIAQALISAQRGGVAGLVDFRENSLKGLGLFAKAYNILLQHIINTNGYIGLSRYLWPMVLGRPESERFDKHEILRLLHRSSGINISSLADTELDYVHKIRETITRYNEEQKNTAQASHPKKLFAFHASERVREDVDAIIGLRPDFVVHCAKATERDLARMAEAGIPIVVCPSSNLFFGVPLDLQKMLRNQVSLALGTDNGMLHPPSILAEMRSLLKNFALSHSQALEMALLFRDRYMGISGNNPDPAPHHQHQSRDTSETRRKRGYLYQGSTEGFMVVEGAGALDEFDPERCKVRVY